MPELPEAETIARGLHARIAGRSVEKLRVHRQELVEPTTPEAFTRLLVGRRIRGVGRRGKWIVAPLDDGCRWVTQLRMTGRFRWVADARGMNSEPHLSLTLSFRGADGLLRFYDVRRFARMRILDPDAWSAVDERLGPEPLSGEFTPAELRSRLGSSRMPIRNALLDQRRIAGIGNVYANEICHFAGIDPRRGSAGLTDDEVERLHREIRRVLQAAIERKGTTFSDFRDPGGSAGGFQEELAVYGRAGEPCHHCGTAVERAVMAGRSAFYCPQCQV